MKISQTKDIRSLNRMTILNNILANQPVSRAEVAYNMNLNKTTVSTIVKEWIDMGLVKETELGDSTGGRKPIMLHQVENAGYCIAVDINVNHINIIVCSLSSRIVEQRVIPIENKDFTTSYRKLSAALNELIMGIPESDYGIIGIGISVHGVVDLDGIIRNIPVLGWKNIDLKTLIENEFAIPVYVNNDGNLSAMYEMKHHPEYRDMTVLNIGDTISAGFVADGRVIHGFLGFANAIGHHTVNFTEQTPCFCGKCGCWEQYCTDRVLIDKLNARLEKPIKTVEELIQAVKDGNSGAREILKEYAKMLAVGISNAIFILNSEVIIINSKITTAFPYLLPEIESNILLPITQVQNFIISDLGEYSYIFGAADEAIQQFYKKMASK